MPCDVRVMGLNLEIASLLAGQGCVSQLSSDPTWWEFRTLGHSFFRQVAMEIEDRKSGVVALWAKVLEARYGDGVGKVSRWWVDVHSVEEGTRDNS